MAWDYFAWADRVACSTASERVENVLALAVFGIVGVICLLVGFGVGGVGGVIVGAIAAFILGGGAGMLCRGAIGVVLFVVVPALFFILCAVAFFLFARIIISLWGVGRPT
jgi:hypothetical protein